jgi:hypothetical protein
LRYSLFVKKWLCATALLFAAPLIAFDPSTPVRLQGVACRVNRQIDRFIVAGDAGRIAVELGDEGKVTFNGENIDESDMRPGDRVRITGNTTSDGVIVADSIDVDRFTGRTLLDALFPGSSIIGRFSVREAKTEFFSVNLPGRDYLRVDGRSAYGPKGRVRAGSLKSGDLLELRGRRKNNVLEASYISVITDEEPTSCRADARRGESKEATATRETAEQLFLDHQR